MHLKFHMRAQYNEDKAHKTPFRATLFLVSGESGVVYKGYIDTGSGRELVAVKTVKGIAQLPVCYN